MHVLRFQALDKRIAGKRGEQELIHLVPQPLGGGTARHQPREKAHQQNGGNRSYVQQRKAERRSDAQQGTQPRGQRLQQGVSALASTKKTMHPGIGGRSLTPINVDLCRSQLVEERLSSTDNFFPFRS